MTTALLTHSSCLEHVTPDGHPERIARLRAVLSALEDAAFDDLLRIDAPEVPRAALERAHPSDYIDAIEAAAPEEGLAPVDGDTWLSPGTLEAAKRCAGAVVHAVDLVLDGAADNAFCAVRPPGHHAEAHQAMGFCFFSSAAIGVLHALDARGLSRVGVVDFDVHHGNGTQAILEREPRAFFGSTHQSPLFPGTGAAHETGVGQVVNAPLPAMSGGAEFRAAMEDRILPALDAFAPELVVISAGFDAHLQDPLANLSLREEDFVWATERICDVADQHSGGRVVSTLEGGYDLDALARSAAAHIRTLMARGEG